MADQTNDQTKNQPTGSYQPTTGNTVGVNNVDPHGPFQRRRMPLPPMTIGREQGITPIKQTPEGTGHTADKE